MTLDPATFRSVLGRFASGVTVVTAVDDGGEIHGMTVTAFSSVSLDPPLILVCIDHEAALHPLLPRVTRFTVNILSAEQEAIARRFAAEELNRFDGVGYTRGASGAPLIDDALAHLECRVRTLVPAGDHTVVIGEVEAATTRDARPLLYYRGGYAQLER